MDEHVLLPGRMICDDGRQADGEEVEERLGRWVDDLRSRLRVVGDVVGW